MPGIDRMQEVLKLVQETGDRCIILPEGADPYVVMDLGSYRTLLKSAAKKQDLSQLNEQEMLDRINQQIAEWRETKRGDVTDYELSQFRIQEPTEIAAKIPKLHHVTPVRDVENQVSYHAPNTPELPIVEEDESEEYHLEPLA